MNMIKLEKISGKDCSYLTELSVKAFHSDSEIIHGVEKDGPPGYDSEDFHRKVFTESDYSYKITVDGRTAGAVWLYLKTPHHIYLARIFIDPEYHRQGVGIETFRLLFDLHPEVLKWSLETPVWNIRTKGFYEKIGFQTAGENSEDIYFEYRKRFLVLMGSPRLNGNTAELLKPFISLLRRSGAEVEYICLAGKDIHPCDGCYACQQVEGEYGCVHHDEGEKIIDKIIGTDTLVLATPIYRWYCPSEMKALLDRHYGLNKFYGKAEGSLWQNKRIALITTHGYDTDYGAGPFETGIERLCKHSGLRYLGMYSVRDLDDLASFRTNEAVSGAEAFAMDIIYR